MFQAISWAACGTLFTFLMTALGAATVFFFARAPHPRFRQAMLGFAAGVMTAASVWSLLIPAIERSEALGLPGWLPAGAGLLLGAVFLAAMDLWLTRLQAGHFPFPGSRGSALLAAAITLHNIPEGMAVGVVYAGLVSGAAEITAGGALALALGIAIQNFPEGAIISMPLHAEGASRKRSFVYGALSGAVEPVFGFLTVMASSIIVPAMPYLLSFAAGAMLYVVVEELIPEMTEGEHSHTGVLMFAFGFSLMMALDVALG